jgi:ABC-type cobalamin/Fe3+-siderophores transport system ATPase subunit
VLVTHDARLAARYARRQITLQDGQIVGDLRLEQGPAEHVAAPLAAPAMEVVR